MANVVKYNAFEESKTSALTTELNSLADGSNAISAEIANETDLDMFADFELNVTFGTAPAGEQAVELYLIPALDGTNYADGSGSVDPAKALLAGVFEVRAVTSAQRVGVWGVRLPPSDFKVLVINEAGQAFPASGSTVQYRRYNINNNG